MAIMQKKFFRLYDDSSLFVVLLRILLANCLYTFCLTSHLPVLLKSQKTPNYQNNLRAKL